MTEREMFEAWYKSKEYSEKPTLLQSGKYSGWIKQELWEAWLASASREGYKLVPVEPTGKMKDVGNDFQAQPNEWIEVDGLYKAMIGVVE